jgi:hypothetical protein
MTTKLQTIRIAGEITALSPISYTLPGSNGFLPQMGKEKRLFITASALRSTIRHAATELISEMQNKKPSLDDYFLMALGGIKNAGTADDAKGAAVEQPKEGTDAAAEKENNAAVGSILKTRFARQKNPMVTLFGSMPHGIPGALMCGHAIATQSVAAETFKFVRANDFQRDPELADRLDDSAIADFVRRQSDQAIRSAANAKRKVLEKQLTAAKKSGDADLVISLQEQIKQVGDGGSNVVALSNPGLDYKAIPMGTQFSHEFTLSNVTEAEIAIFVQALDRFGLMPFIGGKRALGLGHLSLSYSVRGRAAGEREFRNMGTLLISGDMEGVKADGEIAHYLDSSILRAPIERGEMDFSEAGLNACLPATKN